MEQELRDLIDAQRRFFESISNILREMHNYAFDLLRRI
jgi:hypothetical protein